MAKALLYGIISFAVGTALAFFNPGIGVVAAVSIIGVGIIESNQKK